MLKLVAKACGISGFCNKAPLNNEFYSSVNEALDAKEELFETVKGNCGCIDTFGYCCCSGVERAVRFVAQKPDGMFFNRAQREILISESVWQSEGSYDEREVKAMNDVQLARVWLETASDYVNSQI